MNTLIKTLIASLLALCAAAAFAAVEVNQANQAELESIKGIGPAMSTRILDARKSGNFKDWADLTSRVKGMGASNSTKFSADGLTVAGAAFSATPDAAKAPAKAAKPQPAARK